MILFAAIKPDRRTIAALQRHQKGVAGARWVDPEKLHITTAYFGDVKEDFIEYLDRELARLSMHSFELCLRGGGHFGSDSPHAIWAGVKPHSDLLKLHKHCKHAAQRCGIVLEARQYRPHITLAYLKPFSSIERIIAFEKRLTDFAPPAFLVDEFFLFSSHRKARGPNLYRFEASYPLIGPSV